MKFDREELRKEAEQYQEIMDDEDGELFYDVMPRGSRDLLDKLLKIPIVIANKLLAHKHEDDAGWDIEAIEDVVLEPKEVTPMIHTGLKVHIPKGYFGLIKERSSLAAKGIFVLGGVIDSGYHGEIMVNLGNLGGYSHVVKSGDRIAQLIILPCKAVVTPGNPEEYESERGEKGFGSTGR